jgi:hypothetical protein
MHADHFSKHLEGLSLAVAPNAAASGSVEAHIIPTVR